MKAPPPFFARVKHPQPPSLWGLQVFVPAKTFDHVPFGRDNAIMDIQNAANMREHAFLFTPVTYVNTTWMAEHLSTRDSPAVEIVEKGCGKPVDNVDKPGGNRDIAPLFPHIFVDNPVDTVDE
jgi:hypothetical protein